MTISAEQQAIKDEFIRVRGGWSDVWQSVLELDAGFFAAYARFSSVPWVKGPLEPKVKEFIHIAVDAAATHLYVPGIRRHIEAAKAHGATAAEIMDVLACTSTIGIHAMNVGVPTLVEVLAERSIRTEPADLDEYQERLKAEFTATRGYWNSTWDELLELDPELFEAYTAFSSVPWERDVLSPKVKELIYIAFDTSATHLYRVGLKLHIENALDYGATIAEILEVMEIASTIGIQAVETGAPILAEVYRDEIANTARGV